MESASPILIFCGLMGCGKTTLSKSVLNKLHNYTRFNSDDARRDLGLKTFDRKDTPRVNEYMYSRARALLKEGKGVLFDSAYKLKEAREKIYAIGREFNVPVLVIECICSPETSIKRISMRTKDGLHSPTNSAEVYKDYAKIWESPESDLHDHKDLSLVRADTDFNTIDVVHMDKNHASSINNIISVLRQSIAHN